MADPRRFECFARFLIERFPAARRIADVAGGMGRLNVELTRLGREVVTFDRRVKHLPVAYVEREFDAACIDAFDLVVGMHPDDVTRAIVTIAAARHLPFAIVPCCADNGMSYRPWFRFLRQLALDLGFCVEEAELPITGRARVLIGAWPSA